MEGSCVILNKKSRTADRGWPYSFGVGRRANNPHRKKYMRCEVFTRASGLDGFSGTT
jgi:hypothetical protein